MIAELKSGYACVGSAATRSLIGLCDGPLDFFRSVNNKYVSLVLTLTWQMLQTLGARCFNFE